MRGSIRIFDGRGVREDPSSPGLHLAMQSDLSQRAGEVRAPIISERPLPFYASSALRIIRAMSDLR
jgi:hypothetical protein